GPGRRDRVPAAGARRPARRSGRADRGQRVRELHQGHRGHPAAAAPRRVGVPAGSAPPRGRARPGAAVRLTGTGRGRRRSGRPARGRRGRTARGSGPAVVRARRAGISVAGAAVLIGAVTVVARVAGFGRTVVFAQTVGENCLGTAYVTANQVPTVLYEIVIGGALS